MISEVEEKTVLDSTDVENEEIAGAVIDAIKELESAKVNVEKEEYIEDLGTSLEEDTTAKKILDDIKNSTEELVEESNKLFKDDDALREFNFEEVLDKVISDSDKENPMTDEEKALMKQYILGEKSQEEMLEFANRKMIKYLFSIEPELQALLYDTEAKDIEEHPLDIVLDGTPLYFKSDLSTTERVLKESADNENGYIEHKFKEFDPNKLNEVITKSKDLFKTSPDEVYMATLEVFVKILELKRQAFLEAYLPFKADYSLLKELLDLDLLLEYYKFYSNNPVSKHTVAYYRDILIKKSKSIYKNKAYDLTNMIQILYTYIDAISTGNKAYRDRCVVALLRTFKDKMNKSNIMLFTTLECIMSILLDYYQIVDLENPTEDQLATIEMVESNNLNNGVVVKFFNTLGILTQSNKSSDFDHLADEETKDSDDSLKIEEN